MLIKWELLLNLKSKNKYHFKILIIIRHFKHEYKKTWKENALYGNNQNILLSLLIAMNFGKDKMNGSFKVPDFVNKRHKFLVQDFESFFYDEDG